MTAQIDGADNGMIGELLNVYKYRLKGQIDMEFPKEKLCNYMQFTLFRWSVIYMFWVKKIGNGNCESTCHGPLSGQLGSV